MTAQQTTWPIVDVDGPKFNDMILLFRDLRLMKEQTVRQMQPRICLQCWMVISLEDAPQHKKHNQTSDFAQMEEANKQSFLGLCKQYDRLTADCKQVILMKVQPKLIENVEAVRAKQKQAPASAPAAPPKAIGKRKQPDQIQEVDLTNAISITPPKQKKAAEANKRANVSQAPANVHSHLIAGQPAHVDPAQLPGLFNQFLQSQQNPGALNIFQSQALSSSAFNNGKKGASKKTQAAQMQALYSNPAAMPQFLLGLQT